MSGLDLERLVLSGGPLGCEHTLFIKLHDTHTLLQDHAGSFRRRC